MRYFFLVQNWRNVNSPIHRMFANLFVCGMALQWVRNKRKMLQCLVGKEKKQRTNVRNSYTNANICHESRAYTVKWGFSSHQCTQQSYPFSLLAVATSDCFLAFFLYILAFFFHFPHSFDFFFHSFRFIFFIRCRAHVRLQYSMF